MEFAVPSAIPRLNRRTDYERHGREGWIENDGQLAGPMAGRIAKPYFPKRNATELVRRLDTRVSLGLPRRFGQLRDRENPNGPTLRVGPELGLSSGATSLALNEGGQLLAVGGYDQVTVFDRHSGRELGRVHVVGKVETVALGPDGSTTISLDQGALAVS